MKDIINNLIKDRINPVLAQHNGGCELVNVDDNGVATIKLIGSCTMCPGKKHTFMKNVKPFMLESIEGLKDVVLE